MTTFNERENAFENKYAHDQEADFKATARRNKLLGLWAAKQLGLPEAEWDGYAKDVILSDFEKPGDDDIVEKVVKDFSAAGLTVGEHEIRAELLRLLPIAREEIRNS